MEQLLNFFISPAHADTAAAASSVGGGMSFIVIFAIFFVFMYFTIWRPQSKRAKEQRTMLDALEKNDEVVTAGGLLGRIVKISDPYLTINIANNVDIVMQKSSVVNVLPKGTLKSIE
jgi:preprotein translocase subunit YajC